MEIANGTYLGDLRVEVTHLKSGKTIISDAPPDNQGKGESFSPTDLMSVSLGTCMLTIMGIAARTNKINIEGTKMKVSKVMGSNPRRVIEVHIEFEMPSGNFSEKEKDILKNAAVTCPVAKSLHSDIIQGVEPYL
jgi:putative redox protein